MNKVIASASPAINAEGLDIWLLQVPELLVGFLIVVGTTGLAVLGVNGHVEVPTGGREKSPLRCG